MSQLGILRVYLLLDLADLLLYRFRIVFHIISCYLYMPIICCCLYLHLSCTDSLLDSLLDFAQLRAHLLLGAHQLVFTRVHAPE